MLTNSNHKSNSNNIYICVCEHHARTVNIGHSGSNALIESNCQPKEVGGTSTATEVAATEKVDGNNWADAS